MNVSGLKLIGVVVGSLCVNALLFYSIGALHQMVKPAAAGQEDADAQHRIVMTRIQKPQPRTENQPRRIRTIQSTGGRQMTGNMHLRFSPDLSAAQGSGVAMHSAQLENMVFEEGETDEPLVPVKVVPLPYPERARDLGIEGELVFEMIIGRDGKVRTFDVITSPHPSISSAARKTVQSWRFKPAKNQGIPVEVRVRQEIEFTLRQ